MLCCSGYKFHQLCSLLCSFERFVPRNKVLSTGIKDFVINFLNQGDGSIRVYQ